MNWLLMENNVVTNDLKNLQDDERSLNEIMEKKKEKI